MAFNIYPASPVRFVKRIGVLVWLLAGAAPSPLAAQSAEGDRFWAENRFAEAKSAYERALSSDPASAHALYRLAVLASWRNDLDSANALADRARAADPANADVRMLQARLAAWQGDFDGAISAYDSVLRAHPDRGDAHLELARTLYWSGDFRRAGTSLARATATGSSSMEMRVFEAQLRRATRGAVEVGAGWNTDSDENTNWWQTIGMTVPLDEVIRFTALAGAQESRDPLREGTRLLGELGVRWSARHIGFTAAGGVRRLEPEPGDSRNEETYRAVVSTESRRIVAALSLAHLPFDETAQLIGSGLDIDVLEGAADITLRRGLVLGAGGGWMGVSDDNTRYSATASLTQALAGRFFVGVHARQMGFDFRGTGYFSPDRFRLAEGRAGWTHSGGWWDARVSGGVGVQQAFEGADVQGEWHVEARVGRRWARGVLELFGNVTNSLERSTTGAYRSGAAGVRVGVGL